MHFPISRLNLRLLQLKNYTILLFFLCSSYRGKEIYGVLCFKFVFCSSSIAVSVVIGVIHSEGLFVIN